MKKNIFTQKNKEILRTYLRSGQVPYLFFSTLINGINETSFELSRMGAQNRLKRKLARKYQYILNDTNTETLYKGEYGERIWICWFQGIENSPDVIKQCYLSVRKYSTKKVVLITEQNYKKYTNLPDYIIKKYEKGVINKTHFSDILRVELLSRHGGIWIDASVMLTAKLPDFITNSELFFFQKCKPGKNGNGVFISSWLISAKSNNNIILKTRDLIFEYWKKKNYLMDYFLFHIFFCIACEHYPQDYEKVSKMDNSAPHYLQMEFANMFSKNRYQEILRKSEVHKLTYKIGEQLENDKNNFYNHIISKSI